MAFFDQAQEMLSQGIDTARGAVSGVAMEQLGFVRGFVRLCNDGWEQGWHEPVSYTHLTLPTNSLV